MSKQLKSSAKVSKTSKKEERRTITLNLSHLIFLHGVISSIPRMDIKDKNMKRFVSDLTFLFEVYIDGIDDDELKKKLKYQPTDPDN